MSRRSSRRNKSEAICLPANQKGTEEDDVWCVRIRFETFIELEGDWHGIRGSVFALFSASYLSLMPVSSIAHLESTAKEKIDVADDCSRQGRG